MGKYFSNEPLLVNSHGTMDFESIDFEFYVVAFCRITAKKEDMELFMSSKQLEDHLSGIPFRWIPSFRDGHVLFSLIFSEEYNKRHFWYLNHGKDDEELYNEWCCDTKAFLLELKRCGFFCELAYEYHTLDERGMPEWKFYSEAGWSDNLYNRKPVDIHEGDFYVC
jgi:hypothetical protein